MDRRNFIDSKERAFQFPYACHGSKLEQLSGLFMASYSAPFSCPRNVELMDPLMGPVR